MKGFEVDSMVEGPVNAALVVTRKGTLVLIGYLEIVVMNQNLT